MNRPLAFTKWLRNFIPLAFIALSAMAGCGGKERKLHIVVMVDDSASALQTMQQKYESILVNFGQKLESEDSPTLSLYVFTNSPRILRDNEKFGGKESLYSLIDERFKTGAVSAEKGTYYAPMLRAVIDECERNPDRDVRVLILSDGAPDDKKKDDIAEAATDLYSQKNLLKLAILPVRDDGYYRSNLRNTHFKPLDKKLVVGGNDDMGSCLQKLIRE